MARALHRLVNEHFLPILVEKKLPESTPFRDKELWTNEVNDVLESNLGRLREIYKQILETMDHPQRYVKPHIKSKKLISIDQVLHYFHVNGICRDGHANTSRNKKEKFLFNT